MSFSPIFITLFILVSSVYLIVGAGGRKIDGKLVGFNRTVFDKIKGESVCLYGDDFKYTALVKKDRSFSFFNVDPGSYLLQVISTRYVFSNVQIEVGLRNNSQPKVVHAEKQTPLPYPLKLEPEYRIDYFLPRESFQLSSLLKNQMVIMIAIPLVFTFLIPRLMGSFDQEALRELQNPGTSDAPREDSISWNVSPLTSSSR
jgi:hypothetical protein